jgi:hypothetical protein
MHGLQYGSNRPTLTLSTPVRLQVNVCVTVLWFSCQIQKFSYFEFFCERKTKCLLSAVVI